MVPGLGLALLTLPLLAFARADILRSTGGLPPHIAGQFQEVVGFQQARSGEYYVFDRRAHTVYRVDVNKTAVTKAVEIGGEPGRILDPSAFDLEPNGSFVVADAPNRIERIQIFDPKGGSYGSFALAGRASARLTLGNIVLNGVGSLQYTGQAVYVNHPEIGALITEYSLSGRGLRNIGHLRATGHEADRDLHLGLNIGLPLINPLGGFYFVFLSGEPMFRRYGADGTLMYERRIQGRELDPFIAALPQVWPRRVIGGEELPAINPTVRTAAVDPEGNLWISFTVPYTYVFDPDGDRIRVVQFQGAGIISPTSLFFTPDGRALVTPGCYEFKVGGMGSIGGIGSIDGMGGIGNAG